MYKSLVLLSLLTTPLMAIEPLECKKDYVKKGSYGYFKEFTCENGFVSQLNEYKDNHQTLMNQIFYKKGLPIEERGWSTEGVQTRLEKFEYFKDGTYAKSIYNTYDFPRYIARKEFYDKEVIFKKCRFRKKPNNLKKCTLYNKEVRSGVETYSLQGKKQYVYEFLQFSSTNKDHLQAFRLYNGKGELVGKFDEREKFDALALIKSQFKGEEQLEKIQSYLSPKIPVAILDTGFDVNHKELTYKLFRNPNEPIDGIDNDNNGWIDDFMGWHRTNEPVLKLDISRNNIQELVFLGHGDIPSSHGTHVAGIALKDTEKFGLIGYAGDMSDLDLLDRASKNLQELNVEFMNMSLAYGNYRDPFGPKRESFDALEKLIKTNTHTLFFIAASNGDPGKDLDIYRNKTYPASFEFENTLVVGALNTDEFSEKEMKNYKMAKFSYFGKETVDIFAPGKDVLGPRLGGGSIRYSGTSMATPYVMNIALKAKEISLNLSSEEIKKIIMQTAYVPKVPLKCKSGGMIYPQRILEVAKQHRYSKRPLAEIIEEVNKIIKPSIN